LSLFFLFFLLESLLILFFRQYKSIIYPFHSRCDIRQGNQMHILSLLSNNILLDVYRQFKFFVVPLTEVIKSPRCQRFSSLNHQKLTCSEGRR
jgi:hypothetical protein